MKRERFFTLIILFCCICYYSCHSGENSTSGGSTNHYSLPKESEKNKIVEDMKLLDSITFNFGNIEGGNIVTHAFRFTNIGKEPLIIESATATCGCTVASYNKRPIGPGMTDSIVAVFKSYKESPGFQNKVVTINYNTSRSPKLLTLYGHVK